MRASSTGLPFLLPPEAGLVSPSAGVSLWLLSPGAVDAQKGLPQWSSSSSSSSSSAAAAAAVFKVQGPGVFLGIDSRPWSWSSSQGQTD